MVTAYTTFPPPAPNASFKPCCIENEYLNFLKPKYFKKPQQKTFICWFTKNCFFGGNDE